MERNNGRTGNLEARLTELDLSDQSRVRGSLGRQLKERLASNPPAEITPLPETRRWNMVRRPIPAFVLGILVALVFLAVALPEGRAALSKVGKFFQLGDNTVFHQQEDYNEAVMDSILASSAKEIEKGEIYFLHNIYGGFGDYHGDDSYRHRVEPQLDQPGVHHHGPVPHAEVPGKFATMDVMVIPSIWLENAPFVIREAFVFVNEFNGTLFFYLR